MIEGEKVGNEADADEITTKKKKKLVRKDR